MRIFRNQRGDTILEVLIAVAVLSLILTTAFVLANRSSQSNQQTAERGEAYKITQSEMELLKTKLSNVDARNLPAEGSYFCFLDNGDIYTFNGGPSEEDEATLSGAFYDLFDENQAAADCRGGLGGYYHTYIYRGTAAEGQPNTFTAYTKWFAVTGNGVDKVEIVHRIYPDEARLNRDNIGTGGGGSIPECRDGDDNDRDGLTDYRANGSGDPDCTSESDSNEAQTEQTITGYIRAAADCYAVSDPNRGCPEMRAVFYWADNSTNTQTWIVNNSSNGGLQNYNYSFAGKNLGITLSRVEVQMTTDKWDGSLAQDRNLYVHSYAVGAQTYPAFQTGSCSRMPGYYTGNDVQWHCGTATVTYHTKLLKKLGSEESACKFVGTEGCYNTPYGSIYSCQSFRSDYQFTGIPSDSKTLVLDYGDANCGLPTPSAGVYSFNINVDVNSMRVASNVSLNPNGGIVLIDLGTNLPTDATIRIEWTNDYYQNGADADFEIYRVGVR